MPPSAVPSDELLEDIVFSARYGELEEIQEFVKAYGIQALVDAKNDRGNGCLHMAAANGHNDVLQFLLPRMPPASLTAVNDSGNTPLHWAAMNGHLETLRLLVGSLPKSALFLQNQFGRTPLSEAEAKSQTLVGDSKHGSNSGDQTENSPTVDAPAPDKHQECAGFLLGLMDLEGMKEDGKDGVTQDDETDVGAIAPQKPPDLAMDHSEQLTSKVSKLSVNGHAQ